MSLFSQKISHKEGQQVHNSMPIDPRSKANMTKYQIIRSRLKSMLIKYDLLHTIRIIKIPFSRIKYINVMWMIMVFFLKPTKLYKYSVRNCLPSENMKDEYKDDLFDLYQPVVKSNFTIEKIDRILYAKGHIGPIDYNQAILCNFAVTDENRRAIFITGDWSILSIYLREKVDVIYVNWVYIDNNERVHSLNPLSGFASWAGETNQKIKTLTVYMKNNSRLHHTPTGSGIMSILALLMVSKTLTVYGWNYYQTKKMSSMGSIEFVLNAFFYLRDYQTKDCVEYSLTHLFYAYYFSKIQNLTIYGNLNYFENKKLYRLFTNRIQTIFLNNCD